MCTLWALCHQEVTPEQHRHDQPYDDDADSDHGAIQHHLCASASPLQLPCHTHRIHGAAIYGNMDPINIPQMLAIYTIHGSYGRSCPHLLDFIWFNDVQSPQMTINDHLDEPYILQGKIWWNASPWISSDPLHVALRSQGRWPKRRPASPLPSQLPASRLTTRGVISARPRLKFRNLGAVFGCFWYFWNLLEVLQLFLLIILVNENHPMKQTWVKKIKPLVPSFMRLIHPLKRNCVWNS